MKSFYALGMLLSVLLFSASALAQQSGALTGTVKDPNGDVVAGAAVTVRNKETRVGLTTTTDRDGEFTFGSLMPGPHSVHVAAPGFELFDGPLNVVTGSATFNVVLKLGESRITVTAEVGQVQDARNVAQAVNVIQTEQIMERATSVLAQAGEEEAGLNVQKTSPTIGAIVVRGLTGKNVVNFVDGVRYTNGAQRGGINTFFNLNSAGNFSAIEVLRGPNGAQYGSDSLAGTVNLVTKAPAYGFDEPEWHGELVPAFSSADRGIGGSALLSYGTRKFGGYVNFSGRRFGDTRTADGRDSHSAVTRFLGLPSTVLYDVNPGTGFKQYGGSTRLSYSPRASSQLSFYYQRGQQDDGKRFDQLLGGDGNLIADLRNLMLDFGYVRFVQQGFGFFDSASFTGSYNSQREERVNQGGQRNPFGDINHQYERTTTNGGSFFLTKDLDRNSFLVGGDYYHERINSPAYIHNPVTNTVILSRPRVPDDASFNSGGIFVQDQFEIIPDRVRLTGALRYSGASYRARSADSPIVAGAALWPDDELSVADWSGRIGLVVRPAGGLRLAFNYSRGFRYPSMTDLGTLGLTGDGTSGPPAATSIAS